MTLVKIRRQRHGQREVPAVQLYTRRPGLGAIVGAQDFTYTTNSGDITITGHTRSNSVVTLPETINALPVTGISEYAFVNAFLLTRVTIPDSVTSIGEEAFHDCSSLTEVNIGSGVAHIGARVFGSCAVLAAINFGISLVSPCRGHGFRIITNYQKNRGG